MKKIILTLIVFVSLVGCNNDGDFWKRFGPEVLYYQYENVETADFIEMPLRESVHENKYLVKARCSAPNELLKIETFRDGVSVHEVTDFSNEPKLTEYFLGVQMDDIALKGITKIRVVATDKNKKDYSKDFSIFFGPDVLFYEGGAESLDASDVELDYGVTGFLVKAGVRAPNELKQVNIHRDGSLFREVTNLPTYPASYIAEADIKDIVNITQVVVEAVDMNDKKYSKTFTIYPWDGPEIVFYETNEGEPIEETTLEAGVTEYKLKSIVTAPKQFSKIEIYRDDAKVKEITSFSGDKLINYPLEETFKDITATTVIRIKATDKNKKELSKEFTIKVL